MSNIQPLSPYLTDDKKSATEEESSVPDQFIARPEIDYSSVGALFYSSWQRFKSLWTRRFILSLLAGQVVSLCITCTNVTTEELTTGNWQLAYHPDLLLILLHLRGIYALHDLSVWIWWLAQGDLQRRMEIHHLGLLRRRR